MKSSTSDKSIYCLLPLLDNDESKGCTHGGSIMDKERTRYQKQDQIESGKKETRFYTRRECFWKLGSALRKTIARDNGDERDCGGCLKYWTTQMEY